MAESDPIEQISLFDDIEVVRNFEQGKDELNLAEFPICSIYKLRDPSIKTLHFEDQIEDKSTGRLVERKLTVTASDEFGLPCAFDDEVILALIQLTKLQGFQDRKVYFTKRQILEILGWNAGGKNTHRVEESLKRWLGVTLTYDKAWRDRESDDWETEGFHILENVYFKEHQMNQKGKTSYIVWNEVVFRSMKSGNLKSLNFGSFKQLKCPTAKRIFRFLDKRFYHRSRLRFDLEDFAYQKIGIDRRYGPADVKRKLAAGIAELERVGFLKSVPKSERYRKAQKKKWNIYFEKGSPDQVSLPLETEPQSELEARMEGLGVAKSRARKIFDSHAEDFLRLKIEQLEFLMASPETRPKNPAGFLVKSITEDYEAPQGFKSQAEKQKEEKTREDYKKSVAAKKKALEDAERAKREKEEQETARQAERVAAYLDSLSESKRDSFVENAYAEARAKGDDWVDKEGILGDVMRESAVSERVLAIIGKDENSN